MDEIFSLPETMEDSHLIRGSRSIRRIKVISSGGLSYRVFYKVSPPSRTRRGKILVYKCGPRDARTYTAFNPKRQKSPHIKN